LHGLATENCERGRGVLQPQHILFIRHRQLQLHLRLLAAAAVAQPHLAQAAWRDVV
jgi:hypothetical protein